MKRYGIGKFSDKPEPNHCLLDFTKMVKWWGRIHGKDPDQSHNRNHNPKTMRAKNASLKNK